MDDDGGPSSAAPLLPALLPTRRLGVLAGEARVREAAAVKIRFEKSTIDSNLDPQSTISSKSITARAPRSSMDSTSSFQSAIEGACADVRDLALDA